jgi:hypothetical protein
MPGIPGMSEAAAGSPFAATPIIITATKAVDFQLIMRGPVQYHVIILELFTKPSARQQNWSCAKEAIQDCASPNMGLH